MNFKIYFFKDRANAIDFEKVIELLLNYKECSMETDDNQVKIKYNDEQLSNTACFFFKKKSIVPNIHKLNAKYANINFHLEIPPLLPDFKVNSFLSKVTVLARTFSLFMYSELFENVLAYKPETILIAYGVYKEAYKVKFPEEMQGLKEVEKEKLKLYLTYEAEYEKLIKYYSGENIAIPRVQYMVDEIKNTLFTAIEWKEEERTIFPPFVDYVVYINNAGQKMFCAKEVISAVDKCICDLPGFMQGTKVTNKKTIKKCKKLMKKYRFSLIVKKYKLVKQTDLID